MTEAIDVDPGLQDPRHKRSPNRKLAKLTFKHLSDRIRQALKEMDKGMDRLKSRGIPDVSPVEEPRRMHPWVFTRFAVSSIEDSATAMDQLLEEWVRRE